MKLKSVRSTKGVLARKILKGFYPRIAKDKRENCSARNFPKNPQRVVPLATTQKNLGKLIKRAKKITKNIIFLGLTNIDESKSMPVFWEGENTNIFFTQANINLYNAKIKELSIRNNLFFIDMFNVLKNEDLKDGLHPNYRGHKKIFEKIKDFLTSDKIVINQVKLLIQ